MKFKKNKIRLKRMNGSNVESAQHFIDHKKAEGVK